MTPRRVVVTGLGSITPLGKTVSEFWDNLIKGTSGARPITHFDVTDFPTKFAGQIDNYNPTDYFPAKEARRLDKFTQYALIAAEEAINDSKLELDQIDKNRVAVLVGTGIGGFEVFYRQCLEFAERGPRGVSPFFIPMLIPDIAA